MAVVVATRLLGIGKKRKGQVEYISWDARLGNWLSQLLESILGRTFFGTLWHLSFHPGTESIHRLLLLHSTPYNHPPDPCAPYC